MKFCFGDIVVVDDGLIGVVVKVGAVLRRDINRAMMSM